MGNAITTSFKITCNGTTKDSLTDYEWALNNPSDCIGDPVKQTSIVTVPFGETYDLADEILGFPWFIGRTITLKLGYKIDLSNTNHRDYISDLRNLYEGRKVQIKFDSDSYYTWSGTAYIRNATAKRTLGEFDLVIEAEATKVYSTASTSQKAAGTSATFTPISPYPTQFIITGTFDAATTITSGILSYVLPAGTYTDYAVPSIYVATNNVTLSGSWTTTITMKYYKRSL